MIFKINVKTLLNSGGLTMWPQRLTVPFGLNRTKWSSLGQCIVVFDMLVGLVV